MVLSIGMIVKNEEKNLERCLTALKPILESIDSELIIADTGSMDKTVEIAKKFTENVFHFEWINDFSAARNSTLECAKGEWYMYIDADEILRDCSDIIHFFNSGEYKKYNSATYIQRSYNDSKRLDLYLDQRVFRLSVKKENLTFVNPIHEGITPFLNPCKHLELIADHSGYTFFDNGVLNEDAKRKGKRNIEILTNELTEEEAKGHVRESIYNQIADSYEAMGMNEKALEYVEKGFEIIDPQNISIFIYYSHKFSILNNLGLFPEIIELSKQYFSENNLARKTTMLTDCYVYMMCGIAYCKLQNYSSAMTYFVSCFDLYDKHLNGKLVTADSLITPFLVTVPRIKFCYETFYQCCIHENKYDDINLVNKFFPISEWLDDHQYMLTHLILRVGIMERTNFNELRELYYKLDEHNMSQLTEIMRWHLFETNKHEQVLRKMAEIVNGDKCLSEKLVLFRQYFIKKNLTFETVTEYISKHGICGNEDIWCIMLLENYDIAPYITAADFNPEQCVYMVYCNYISIQKTAELFAGYDINAISSEGLEIAAGIYGWAMIVAQQNHVDIAPLFEKFGMIGARWFEYFSESETIPEDINATLIVNGIVSARMSGNYALCASEMHRLASVCPPFAPIVSDYSKSMQQEINSSKPAVEPEFAWLSEQFKQNVRAMTGAGNIGDAEELIAEFETFCPNDPEISVLKKQIEAEKRREVPMVLSIGMIVKNEEKYLERCLTAIKPILDSIDSELIIADTGSTDKTVEIAKKFTDNVFHFEWINDFAAARNSTLERAKGEWYMFIDADEIAQDCSDIIHFFKSGEYKRYGSAVYVQRSYTDSVKSDLFLDLKVYRITAIKNDVKFVKPIHEALSPIINPCKDLNFIVDHYGYVFSENGITTEFAKKKSERNLKVLFEELADQEAHGNIGFSIYGQIADCYHTIGEKETALEYLKKGMEYVDPANILITMYYNRMLALLCDLNRPVEAIELCDKYFSKENAVRTKPFATDCYVYLIRAMSNFAMQNYNSALLDFVSGFDLYGKYINNQLFTEDLLVSPFRVTIPLIKSCSEPFYNCFYNTGRYDTAAEALKFFPIECFLSDHEYMTMHLLIRSMVMENTNFNGFADLYHRLDDYNKKQLICIIRWHIFKTDKHEQMLKNLSEVAKGNKNLEDTFSIFRHYFVRNDLSLESVEKYISTHGAIGNEDIWCIMMMSNYDITLFITADSFEPEKCTREVFFRFVSTQDAANLFVNYDVNAISAHGLEKAAGIYGWAMIGAMHNDLNIIDLFEKFGQIGMRWYNEFSDSDNIPGDIKAALIVNTIVSARKNGDYDLCVDEMCRLATVCPPFAPIVNEYQKLAQAEARISKPKVMSEFDRLAAQVKQNIRDMISAGNISAARGTLKELGALCPNDPDIEILKDEINNMLQ